MLSHAVSVFFCPPSPEQQRKRFWEILLHPKLNMDEAEIWNKQVLIQAACFHRSHHIITTLMFVFLTSLMQISAFIFNVCDNQKGQTGSDSTIKYNKKKESSDRCQSLGVKGRYKRLSTLNLHFYFKIKLI